MAAMSSRGIANVRFTIASTSCPVPGMTSKFFGLSIGHEPRIGNHLIESLTQRGNTVKRHPRRGQDSPSNPGFRNR